MCPNKKLITSKLFHSLIYSKMAPNVDDGNDAQGFLKICRIGTIKSMQLIISKVFH